MRRLAWIVLSLVVVGAVVEARRRMGYSIPDHFAVLDRAREITREAAGDQS